jgi:hypothetical protein
MARGKDFNVTQCRVQAACSRCRSQTVEKGRESRGLGFPEAFFRQTWSFHSVSAAAWGLIGEVFRAVKRGMDAGPHSNFQGNGAWPRCVAPYLLLAPGP